jgi:hypothetical protein
MIRIFETNGGFKIVDGKSVILITGFDPRSPEAGCDACADTPGQIFKDGQPFSSQWHECPCQLVSHLDQEDASYDAWKEDLLCENC